MDHVTNGNRDYPHDSIVRIWDFVSTETDALLDGIISRCCAGRDLVVNDFSFVNTLFAAKEEKLTLCRLALLPAKGDIGIVQAGRLEFECVLTVEVFKKMAEMIASYWKDGAADGYHWLYNLDNPIDLLLSVNGMW